MISSHTSVAVGLQRLLRRYAPSRLVNTELSLDPSVNLPRVNPQSVFLSYPSVGGCLFISISIIVRETRAGSLPLPRASLAGLSLPLSP
jgi:hypothetical protein